MNWNQPPHGPHGMPPVPRDHDRASLTEMLPFGSRKIRMTRSPLTIFLLLAALVTPLLLWLLNSILAERDPDTRFGLFVLITVIATFFLTLALAFMMFLYARPGRSVWPFVFAYVFLTVVWIVPQLLSLWMKTPIYFIWEGFTYIFRSLWKINVDLLLTGTLSFWSQFWQMFVAAGLCEELFKALPILFGAALALIYGRRPGPRSGFVRFFQIRGPLDGALMGCFTGASFVFFETGLGYVPTEAAESGAAAGLLLFFPRVFGGAVGHMAYSAIFGYFIGLGVMRRRHFLPLVLGGWLLSSLLHGFWNSVGTVHFSLFYLVAVVSAIFATAVILKGRQLHQASHGEAPETLGSIIIDRSGGGGQGQPAPAGYPPAPAAYGGYPPQAPPQPYPQAQGWPQPPGYQQGGYPPAYPPQGGYPAPPQPQPPHVGPTPAQGYPAPPQANPPEPAAPQEPAAPPPTLGKQPDSAPPAPSPASGTTEPAAWPSFERDLAPQAPTETFAANVAPPPPPAGGEPVLVLDISGLVIPIRAGAVIDLAAEPALGGRAAGARAEVVNHPSRPGVLGLRNSGERSWAAHLRDGRVQPIERDQNLRAAAGVRIDFGDGVVADIVARG